MTQTFHSDRPDWEAIAKALQKSLEKEIDESEILQRELDAAIEALYAHTLAIRYLRNKNGHDPV